MYVRGCEGHGRDSERIGAGRGLAQARQGAIGIIGSVIDGGIGGATRTSRDENIVALCPRGLVDARSDGPGEQHGPLRYPALCGDDVRHRLF